jgi:hypothetical protein
MLTLNQIKFGALALYNCRDDLTINDVILRLVAFTTGLYAFVIAMNDRRFSASSFCPDATTLNI